MEQLFTIKVNGTVRKVRVLPSTPLLWVLRDELKLTGTKFSCGKGLCGACTIHIDGQALRSCVFPISELNNREVTTIEGLASESPASPVLQAWTHVEVPHCGYCQPGQIMAAAAIFKRDPHLPAPDALKQMHNLCRCGSYPQIKKAIEQVFSTAKS